MARFYLSLLLCVVVTLCSSREPPVCQNQINSCSCETDQGLVDLTPLDSGKPDQARFSGIPDNLGDTFAYNPCSPFSEVSATGCVNVAACQRRLTETYNIGEQSNAVFETDPSKGLMIKYTPTDGSNRTTYVTLVCDQAQEGSLTAQGEDPEPPTSSKYRLTLSSKYACPMGGGDTTTPGGEQTTTASPSGGQGECWTVWIIFLSTMCIVLAVICIGLLVYICSRSKIGRGGGATIQVYDHDVITRNNNNKNVGYKEFA